MSPNARIEPRSQSDSPASGSQFSAILNALEIAVLVVGRDGVVHYRNTAAEANLPGGDDLNRILGGAEVLGTFDGWDVELGRVIDHKRSFDVEAVLGSAGDGRPRLVQVHLAPLPESSSANLQGAVVTVGSPIRSATIEQRLEVSQRLASLGKLATRVAHELNNPLDGILRYINLAMRLTTPESEPKLASYLTESRTGLMRMVQIIGDLLEFSRSTRGQFHNTTINEVVEQVIRNLASQAEANNVIVAADFRNQDTPAVHDGRLYQVCSNLVKNAIEAMPDGGRLWITVGIMDDDVVIRVQDTGVGLPEPAERVFEPFFTTKEPGKGTGLGLAICRDFVEDMQGTISTATGEEGGAVFTIRIPVSACHAPFPSTGVAGGLATDSGRITPKGSGDS